MENYLTSIVFGLVGLAIGVVIMLVVNRAGLSRDKQKGQLILEEAEKIMLGERVKNLDSVNFALSRMKK